MILDEIVDYKIKKVEEEKKIISIDEIISKLDNCSKTRDFEKAMSDNKELNIIAEVKKASPSKGIIKEAFDHIYIAKEYEKNNVSSVSVLTEDRFFQGKNEYLSEIKKITSVPILRKDFIIDPYQIYQSKLLGADAILLIAAILSKDKLIKFQNIAKELELDCLVEIHDETELDMVLNTETKIIGINNRDLKTFKTDIKTTEKLIKLIPKDKIIVSESGINTRNDMKFLEGLKVNGVLIGESLMKSKYINEKLDELRGR
ncbi:indole-3-glycerol phosphate synthase TrpC [Tepidibacter aestuarii]|uniref:indole-3-glycerol phosphate synthase TrpC n=1 Tax=Tepidibacter aestuarii TaxID=2925782 RepID=UPI0020C093A0|nr:indole-3-glycerol phosphate synthase TrpC [Tepidibacter aestuarii]CAH2213828.1 Indole-3-glycerol phosphate synthase [Tepidibacter aestuarii]